MGDLLWSAANKNMGSTGRWSDFDTGKWGQIYLNDNILLTEWIKKAMINTEYDCCNRNVYQKQKEGSVCILTGKRSAVEENSHERRKNVKKY